MKKLNEKRIKFIYLFFFNIMYLYFIPEKWNVSTYNDQPTNVIRRDYTKKKKNTHKKAVWHGSENCK
jgi:hypothetical protein